MFYMILGWSAAAVLVPTVWIQVWKNFWNGSAEGVSFGCYACLWYGMAAFATLAHHDNASIPMQVQFISGMVGSAVVLFQIWWYHPHRHVFHKYLMRNHHKEEMPGGKEDVVIHSNHHRDD